MDNSIPQAFRGQGGFQFTFPVVRCLLRIGTQKAPKPRKVRRANIRSADWDTAPINSHYQSVIAVFTCSHEGFWCHGVLGAYPKVYRLSLRDTEFVPFAAGVEILRAGISADPRGGFGNSLEWARIRARSAALCEIIRENICLFGADGCYGLNASFACFVGQRVHVDPFLADV